MLLDSTSLTGQPGDPELGAAADKLRIRFRKAGLLRLVSHHDLMHVFERMLRRAKIPFRSTQGFHPQPRIVFALSLALGVVGCAEVVEIELENPLDPADVRQRLQRHGPPGLEILSVQRIDLHRRAQVVRVQYRVFLPSDRLTEMPRRLTELLTRTELWVERTRPRPRRLNLRPFLHGLRLADNSLEIDLWVSSSAGTARPEEILQILGLFDLVEAGVILERSKLELRDEMPESDAALFCEPLARAEEREEGEGSDSRNAHMPPLPAGESSLEKNHRPAPLLPGPLSFDS